MKEAGRPTHHVHCGGQQSAAGGGEGGEVSFTEGFEGVFVDEAVAPHLRVLRICVAVLLVQHLSLKSFSLHLIVEIKSLKKFEQRQQVYIGRCAAEVNKSLTKTIKFLSNWT